MENLLRKDSVPGRDEVLPGRKHARRGEYILTVKGLNLRVEKPHKVISANAVVICEVFGDEVFTATGRDSIPYPK